MIKQPRFSLAALLSLVLIASLTCSLTFSPLHQSPQPDMTSQARTVHGDEHWTPSFILNGVSGTNAIATDGSKLYAAGDFRIAGDVLANNIAMWNASTNRWSALGNGMDGWVWALAIDPQGNLYAGGLFTLAGGTAANHIARWDGRAWSALGSGLDGEVYALAVDSRGNVFAGGSFTSAGGVPTRNIAKWNAATRRWTALGSGINGPVRALAVGSGQIYAGGSFSKAGGSAASNIARWNGSTWKALGAGVSGGSLDGYWWVRTLAVDSAGNLYAGGDFTIAGAASVNHIARWDGTRWTALGDGLTMGIYYDTFVSGLAVYGGDVFASGDFTMSGVTRVNNIARWNGTQWEALGSGTNGSTFGLTIDHSGNVFVFGDFSQVESLPAYHIARWDGQDWSVLGVDNSLNSTVYAIGVDPSNQVYAGGWFTTAGGQPANGIARWDGSNWSALGEGINGGVLAISLDNGSKLYAGGTFTMTAGIQTNHIARWDGSNWSALGTGINGDVYAVATDGIGNVYAGGNFSMAGDTPANNIAKWNSSTNQWEALGPGLDRGIMGGVLALAVDQGSNLYAGGGFTQAGGLTVNHVAKWDGSAWSALGGGVCCGGINKGGWDLTEVSALALDSHGNLYAGGIFLNPGNNVAMWNGSNWQGVGGGITQGRLMYGPKVNAIAVDPSNHIIVGGDFIEAEGLSHIALWDGNSWSALGSGISGYCSAWRCVLSIATDSDGNIYVGGDFDVAGGKPSVTFARWAARIFYTFIPVVVH